MDENGRPAVKFGPGEIDVFRSSVRLAATVRGSFLEVGIAKAVSTSILLETLADLHEGRRVWGVDKWEGPREWHERAAKEHGGLCDVRYVVADSRSWVPPEGEVFAWVFVDGSHARLRHVWGDATAWAPRVSPRGVLVFHDSNRRTVQTTIESHPFLLAHYDVERATESWPGIAVLRRRGP